MRTQLVDHPLVAHKVSVLRDTRTDSPTFRHLVDELVTLLAFEATRELPVTPVSAPSPLGPAAGHRLTEPGPVVIPILRAGLGMLEGMSRLLPMARIGFLGMVRDEETLLASTYADRLPEDLRGRHVFLLDPMLATGGTLAMAVSLVLGRGAPGVTILCLLAAPEGIRALEASVGTFGERVRLVVAAIDERLNDRGYIVPGLGDAGDRMYGTL